MKNRIKINIFCWNVRTFLDQSSSNRPERRTMPLAKELQSLTINIEGLSETRVADDVVTSY